MIIPHDFKPIYKKNLVKRIFKEAFEATVIISIIVFAFTINNESLWKVISLIISISLIVIKTVVDIISFFRNRKLSEKSRFNYKAEFDKKYPLCKQYQPQFKIDEPLVFPIIICANSYSKNIVFEDNKDKYHELPSSIEKYKNEIFYAYDNKNITNSLDIRITDIKEEKNRIVLKSERTYYLNSILTNRTPDLNFSDGLSIREMFEPGPNLSSLSDSKMSNHIGFNCFIITDDNFIPFIRRKKELSVGAKTIGTSVSASIKAKYALNEDGTLKNNCLGYSICMEIIDELNLRALERFEPSKVFSALNIDPNNLSSDEKDKKICEYIFKEIDITPEKVEKNIICFYRDLVELGKPQFISYAKIKVSKNELMESLNGKIVSNFEKETNSVATDGKNAFFIAKDEFINTLKITKNNLFYSNKKKKVTPSTAGTIAYFRDFININNI